MCVCVVITPAPATLDRGGANQRMKPDCGAGPCDVRRGPRGSLFYHTRADAADRGRDAACRVGTRTTERSLRYRDRRSPRPPQQR